MQGQHKYQPKLFVQIDIEKLIPQNHFLRKIDQILDLSFVRELTKEYYCQNNGRPSIDPELFFRIILIGYIFNISSDRKLCEELRYNLAYRWYCKLEIDDFTPDHSSLSRIRDRYEASVFEKFFDKVVDLCKDYGLVKGERIITDGTLIEANASIEPMVSRNPSESDEAEPRTDVTAPLPSKKLSNKTHISKTDPDSSLAKKEGTARSLKYKIHISIDADSRVILDNKVTTGGFHETQIYLDRLAHIKDKYELPILSVIADRGYGSAENIQFLQSENITTYIPLFSNNSGKVHQLIEQGFYYDREKDRYQCPAGLILKACNSTTRILYYTKIDNCVSCNMRITCPAKEHKGKKWRLVSRSLQQDFFEIQLSRMQEPIFQNALRERMWKIEGINAEAKNRHGLKRAKYRGIDKVQIQANMVGAVLNIKRIVALCYALFRVMIALITTNQPNTSRINFIQNLKLRLLIFPVRNTFLPV